MLLSQILCVLLFKFYLYRLLLNRHLLQFVGTFDSMDT